MEVVEPVASKVGEWLVPLVIRHCGYMICSDRCVRERNEEVKKLVNAKQRVQHSIDEAKRNQRLIEADVEKWMEDAENAIKEARPAQAHGPTLPSVDEMGIPPIAGRLGCSVEGGGNGETKKICFCGWLPNLKKRYRLGREAKKTVKDIRELIARGQFQKVDYENDPPGLVGGATDLKSLAVDGGDTITDSRASLFQGIMKALEDEKLKVIGIYGPGGVGKSTLLEEVEKKLRKEGRPFKMIAKSTVSQNPDMKKIQDDIAYAFGLNLKDEPSEVGRRDRLSKILKEVPKEKEKEEEVVPKDPKEEKEEEKEKFLIILDDLWDELDLKEVGIPLGDESNKCQLLLTSRDRSVLEQKMGAHLTFHLEGLSNDEAFSLFEKICGDELKADDGLKAKAAQVVAKLAGSPLLIKSVACALKCGDESTWDTFLIKIEDPNIKSIVQCSYDRLKSNETESLFLLCGFVGGSIPVELLLGLGMGLSLFKGFDMTIRSSRSKLNEMLRRLRSICLLQDGGDDKENVTIHDLYSEEVISTQLTGQNFLIIHRNAGSWPKENLGKCWVYLVNVGSDRLAKLRLHWFPDSEIFMLLKQHDKGDCNGLDFASMKELRVLYLRSINFTGLCSSVEILKNLQSLYLCDCYVENVAILGELKTLQILSFAGSKIYSLPKEIRKLTMLKVLNLSNCYNLRKIEPGVLGGLINLEELYMRGIYDPCNVELVELKSLTKLTALEILIPHPTILLENGELPFGELIKFWINIGNARGRKFKGLTTMTLKLEGCDSILLKEWVQKTLQKTQYLYLDGLREFEKSAYELCSRGFSQLKHLEIQNCSSIKHIVSSSNGDFPLLESLFLENLTNLENICDGPGCFSKLKAMRVTKCSRLEYVWCLSHMHRLAQLEEIEVYKCDSMRAIFVDDAGKDIVTANNRVELLNKRRLNLAELPKTTSFLMGAGITSDGAPIQTLVVDEDGRDEGTNDIIEFLLLKRLTIMACPSLEWMFECGPLDSKTTEQTGVLLPKLGGALESEAKRLSHVVKSESQTVLALPNLEEVKVVECSKLRYLFPYVMATTLEKLKSLYIEDCEQMMEVVPKEGGDRAKADVMSFPSLIDLQILWCRNFGVFIRNPTIVERQLGVTAEENDESSQPLFNEMITLPNLRELSIDGVQCKELWSSHIPVDSFCELNTLKLKKCNNLRCIAPSHMWKKLQHCLKFLSVISCRLIEVIYESDEIDTKIVQLEELQLDHLENLRHIWLYNGLSNIPFPNLRCIGVSSCPSLEILFPTFTAEFLGQIERLGVRACKNMELIADHGECEEGTGTTITFSRLTQLRLVDLPKFRGCLPEKYSPEFPPEASVYEGSSSLRRVLMYVQKKAEILLAGTLESCPEEETN